MQESIKLYHFTRIDYIGDIIGKRRLKLTEAGLSNDPFEMNPSFDVNESDPLLMDAHMRELESSWESHKSMEPQTVICLSACVSSVLMWGHYAANHSGICLVFDIPVQEYEKCLIADLEKKYPLLPMQYGMSRIFARNYVEPGRGNTIVYSLGKLLRKLLSYKPLHWSYEREFRLLIPQNAIEYDSEMMYTSVLGNYLSGVILGARCPWSKTKVRALLSSAGYEDAVAVEKATLHPKINSVEINGTDSFYDMPQHIYEHYKKIESCHTSKEQILTLNISHPKDWRDLYNEIEGDKGSESV